MPHILDVDIPSVESSGAPPNDYQRIQTNPNMFGGFGAQAEEKLGQGTQQAGTEALGALTQRRTFYNQVSADDAFNKYQKGLNTILYGDPNDPTKPGYYGLKGSDALNARPAVAQQIDDLRNSIRGGMQTDYSRFDFDTASRRLQMFTMDAIGRHSDDQMNVYGSAVQKASAETIKQSVMLDPNNEEGFKHLLEDHRSTAVKQLEIQSGHNPDPALVNEAILKSDQEMYAARVEGMEARGNAVGAYNFLQSHLDRLEPQQALILQNRLRPALAESAADSLIGGGLHGAPGDAAPARAFLNSVSSHPDRSGDTSGLHPEFATRLAAAIQEARQAGLPVGLESGFRTDDTTGSAYDASGMSLHGKGVAADVNGIGAYGSPQAAQWAAIAERHGLYNPYLGAAGASNSIDAYRSAKEYNHWQLVPYKLEDRPDVQKAIQAAGGDMSKVWDAISPVGSEGRPEGAPPATPAPDKSTLISRAHDLYGSDPMMEKSVVSAVNRKVGEFNAMHASETYTLKQSLPDLVQAAEAGVQGITFPADKVNALLPPAQAQHWNDEFQIAQRVGDVMRGAEWATPQELRGMQQDIVGGQGSLTDMMKLHAKGATSGAGTAGADPDADTAAYFRLREGAAKRLDAEIERRNRMLVGPEADPAAYVMASPAIKSIAANQGGEASNFSDYASATLGVQAHLGVPEEAQHVLTRGEAMNLADTLTKSPDVSQTINAMQLKYGSSWQHVFNDAVTLGKLPTDYQSVAALDDPRDAGLLARAINETKPGADGKPGRDWNDILGNAGGKSIAGMIKDSVRNDPVVAQLEASLSKSGSSARQIDGIVSSIETLAFAKKFYDGDANSAQSAVTSFTGKYEFLPNGGARIPQKFADATTQAASGTLASLTKDTVAVPPAYGSSTAAPDKQEYVDMLKANPTWITAPKGNALWLMDFQGRVVRSQNGQPVQVPFTETAPARPILDPGAAQSQSGQVFGGS
jgi:hypothetical protein